MPGSSCAYDRSVRKTSIHACTWVISQRSTAATYRAGSWVGQRPSLLHHHLARRVPSSLRVALHGDTRCLSVARAGVLLLIDGGDRGAAAPKLRKAATRAHPPELTRGAQRPGWSILTPKTNLATPSFRGRSDHGERDDGATCGPHTHAHAKTPTPFRRRGACAVRGPRDRSRGVWLSHGEVR